MEPERINFFRKRLEALSDEITSFLEGSKDSVDVVKLDTSIGRLSRMDAMQDQQMALELRRRKKRQLRQIEEALKRVDDGSYGTCSLCGQPIGTERLEAFPDVLNCVRCA